ncbi:hypothetical protein EJ06DRAFT_556826 [Trichodelitschia bisporula]|uniref:Transcriptional regulatory protein DEP1 n=1 Tax=Trichodelitschia bisporula TaxID=703511 RepID=A0A6G1HWU7_9PEZI|nr:hypothetical protein EJ06DRAFT_556826 [Trichodelitschia bisporula]
MSAVATQEISSSLDPLARTPHPDLGAQIDIGDDRSSSLSDLDERSEGRADESSTHTAQGDTVEVDSEAETERLEKSPRKMSLRRTASSVARNSAERTPRSSARVASKIPSVAQGNLDEATLESDADGEQPTPSRPASTERKGSDSDSSRRKRKRSTSFPVPPAELAVEGPLAKRSHISPEKEEPVPEEDGVDAEAPVEVSPEEDHDMGGAQDEVDANEPLPEKTPSRNNKKGKKGRIRGKRSAPVEEPEAPEPPEAAEEEPEHVDVEVEEEETSSVDEGAIKKKTAIAVLSGIEKEFVAFREKHLNEQLRQITHELDMLRQPNCTHPDFLAQLECLNIRRDEKVHHEEVLRKYQMQARVNKTVAERCQLHSQYFQTVRELKDKALEKAYRDLYALQRDRRNWGTDELNCTYLYNNNRQQLLQQQAAYNLEVSILSGIAKHIGFPAAPEIRGLDPHDLDDDWQAMGLPVRTPQAQPRFTGYIQPEPDRIAEERFLEQTPWANPNHPVHSQMHAHAHTLLHHAQQPPVPTAGSASFRTPAAQRRTADPHATNGTGSTIEIMSNPPSSAPGTGGPASGPHFSERRQAREAAESPISASKRLSGGASLMKMSAAHAHHLQEIERAQVAVPHQFHSQPTMNRVPQMDGQEQHDVGVHDAGENQAAVSKFRIGPEVGGALVQGSHPALTAPVGGSASRFPP